MSTLYFGRKTGGTVVIFICLVLWLAACGDITLTPIAPSTSPGTATSVTTPSTSLASTFTPSPQPTTPLKRQPPPPLPNVLLQSTNINAAHPGHPGNIGITAISPDRTLLATTSWDQGDYTVKLWNMASGQLRATLTGHIGRIGALAFSPDGKSLASAGSGQASSFEREDYSIHLWDVQTATDHTVLRGHVAGIYQLGFSPDSQTLISIGADENLKYWEVGSGKEKATRPKAKGYPNFVFSPNGHIFQLESLSTDPSKPPTTTRLKDVESGQTIALPAPGNQWNVPHSFTFSQDGKLVAAVWGYEPWAENEIIVWDFATGRSLASFKGLKASLDSLAFSPDSKFLATGGYFLKGQAELSPFDGEPLSLYPITDILPPGQSLVKSWELASGKELFSGNLESDAITDLFYQTDGKLVALGRNGHSARLWEVVASGKLLATFEGAPSVWALAYSLDGSLIAWGGEDGKVRLSQSTTGQQLAVLNAHQALVTAIAFGPDGKTFATASRDRSAKLWALSGLTSSGGGSTLSIKEVATLGGYQAWVNALTFSPDGKLLATASSDSQVKLWDVASGQERFNLKGHPYSVWALAFSPDGKFLASAGKSSSQGSGSSILLWEVATGQLQPVQISYPIPVTALAFSPDGKFLASSADDQSLVLWNVATGRNLTTLKSALPNYSTSSSISEQRAYLFFTPNGQRLISGNREGGVKLWEVNSGGSGGRELFDLGLHYPSGLFALALAPDGGTLAGGYNDASIKTWDLVVAPQAAQPTVSPTLSALPTGAQAVTSPSPNAVDLKPLYATPVPPGHSGPVKSVIFSPDGQSLFSVEGNGTIIRWNVATKQEIATYRGEGWDLLALSPDGKLVAGSGPNSRIRLWEVASGRLVREIQLSGGSERVMALAFSPDGKWLASSGAGYPNPQDNTVQLWEVASGRLIRQLVGHDKIVSLLAFSPDGKELASGINEGHLKFWEVATGLEKANWTLGSSAQLMGLAYSPDGKTVAVSGYHQLVWLWDTASHKERKSWAVQDNSGVLAFSPDGKTLVTGGDGGYSAFQKRLERPVKLWDLNGTLLKTLPTHVDETEALAFSPDGKLLASGGGGGTRAEGDSDIKLIDLASGQEFATLKGYGGGAGVLYLSPDSRTFTAQVSAYTIKQYEVRSGKELSTQDYPYLGDASLAVSWDGKRLASLGIDKRIKLFDLATGRQTGTIYGQVGNTSAAMEFSPDGKLLATTDPQARLLVRFWDVTGSGSQEAGFLEENDAGNYSDPSHLEFSSDGKLLFVSVENYAISPPSYGIGVWEVATHKPIRQFTNFTGSLTAWNISSDGTLLATASSDKTVKLWEVTSGKERLSFKETSAAISDLAFSPDGRLLAAVFEDRTLKIWSLVNGKLLYQLDPASQLESYPLKLKFTPDGHYLLVSLASGSTRVWNLVIS